MVLPKINEGIARTQTDWALQISILYTFVEAPNRACSMHPISPIGLELMAMAMAKFHPWLGSGWHFVNQLKRCRASWLLNILLVVLPGLDFVTDPHIVSNIVQVPLIDGSIFR